MYILSIVLILMFVCFGQLNARVFNPVIHPVLLVPGNAGSQLQAKLTGKPKVVHYYCDKVTNDYFNLWLNLELLLPTVIGCWVDNMKLVYNATDGTTTNMPGVLTRVPGFANTSTVEWLDVSHSSASRYFVDIANALVASGYRRDKNLVAAPYDWRRAPNEYQDYYKNLTRLIEETYRNNGNKKLVIVAHSMGSPTMLYFYNNIVTQDWKDKYIYSHVSLAGAWGGSMQVVRLLASGYNMNHYKIFLPPSYLREMQRSFTSSMFLFPSYNLWRHDDVFAVVGNKNYTTKNVEEFFKDMNYEVAWQQYQTIGHLLGGLEAPNVDMHCVYGFGIDTPEKFSWSHFWFPNYQPSTEYGDGDGTVNRRSLEVCKKWINANGGKKVSLYPLQDAEHMGILQRDDAIQIVKKIVFEQ